MLALLSQGALLGFSSAAQPGPFQGYLVAQSLRSGPRRSLALAAVPLVSDPPVIAVVVTALGQVPDGLVKWLGVTGGLVVLWLGAGTLRAALAAGPSSGTERSSGTAGPAQPPRGFLRASLVNLTNPNAWVFWSLVGGPILTGAWRDSPLEALAFLAGFYACLAGGNVFLVVLAGQAAAGGPRVARALGIVAGLGLVSFGLWQLGRAFLFA